MRYRDINVGEIIKEDDEVLDGSEWRATCSAGKERKTYHLPMRRSIKDNWIAFADQKPTKEDTCKATKFVLWMNPRNDSICFGPIDYCERDSGYIYWMPLAFTLEAPPPIKVDGKEVILNKDGSLTVGCQTVSSKDFEEIARQRTEAMKS